MSLHGHGFMDVSLFFSDSWREVSYKPIMYFFNMSCTSYMEPVHIYSWRMEPSLLVGAHYILGIILISFSSVAWRRAI